MMIAPSRLGKEGESTRHLWAKVNMDDAMHDITNKVNIVCG